MQTIEGEPICSIGFALKAERRLSAELLGTIAQNQAQDNTMTSTANAATSPHRSRINLAPRPWHRAKPAHEDHPHRYRFHDVRHFLDRLLSYQVPTRRLHSYRQMQAVFLTSSTSNDSIIARIQSLASQSEVCVEYDAARALK
jgi:hypothetical protein|tara:strand:+ start:1111 stop:1539 length:429 start_codon:yes stop_codon:yes gene_type:complete